MPFIKSKFGSACRECGSAIKVGDRMFYDGPNRVFCLVCGQQERGRQFRRYSQVVIEGEDKR